MTSDSSVRQFFNSPIPLSIPIPLLTSQEMREADKATIAAGTPESALMQRAAEALVSVITEHYAPCRTVVVCGFGNNGGDGRIAASLLKEQGWEVSVVTPQDNISGTLYNAELIIDALLGTGLNKDLTDQFIETIAAMNAAGCPVIACDIASGINSTTGEVMGAAVKATRTVTFASAKRGHFLLPGKAHTGTLHIMDIGIAVNEAGAYLNTPALWKIPSPTLSDHKYTRGHALVTGGDYASTGAAKLTATAALKVGAGAVSVVCDEKTLPIYAASFMAVMTKLAGSADEFYKLIHEPRVKALAIGMGAGVSEHTQKRALAMLETGLPCVLDADALQPEILAAAHAKTIITPHAGEFTRLFGAHATLSNSSPACGGGQVGVTLSSLQRSNKRTIDHPHPNLPPQAGEGEEGYLSKIEAVQTATQTFKGVLVYKGNDTIIAQAGRALVINGNAPPTLATAGSGDVLAGLITGLLAQGMKPFEAACAGVWLHGNAGSKLGRFFTSEDIIAAI